MGEAYSTLAQFYDGAMDADYEGWVEYLLALTKRFQHVPKSICDLGCGTGNLTVPLAGLGKELMGVDLSAAMVGVAREKARNFGLEIPFFAADLRDFKPGKAFDTVLSCCDVLNYFTSKTALKQAFESVHRLLKTDGLWLFDLNSAHKLRVLYGNQSYADLQGDYGYFWDNTWDPKEGVCTMDLTFFVQTPEGLYQRLREQHRQKLWWPGEIQALARVSRFQVLGCYDFLTTKPVSSTSDRWQFILRKEN